MNKIIKIISAIATGLTLAVAGAGLGYVMHQPDVIEVPYEVEKLINVSIPVEVIKEVQVEVPVDNGKLDKVMDFIEYIDEDITLDFMVFSVDAEIEAEAYIRNNMVSLLDSENYFDNHKVFDDYRKSEVSIRKISDPSVEDYDYDDMDLTLSYTVKVKAKESGEDSLYKHFSVVIPFEDGELQEDDVEVALMD